MTRRLPLLSTLIVAAAVGVMVALALWQVRRAEEKEALITRYESARALSAAVPWPHDSAAIPGVLYRHSRVVCERVLGVRATSGRNEGREPGWAHVARCAIDGSSEAEIVVGWSRDPREVAWGGGEALGIVSPAPGGTARLVASPPLAGLEANAAPDPGDLPNNHMAYAVQWLFFAATAAVIYVMALGKRRRSR